MEVRIVEFDIISESLERMVERMLYFEKHQTMVILNQNNGMLFFLKMDKDCNIEECELFGEVKSDSLEICKFDEDCFSLFETPKEIVLVNMRKERKVLRITGFLESNFEYPESFFHKAADDIYIAVAPYKERYIGDYPYGWVGIQYSRKAGELAFLRDYIPFIRYERGGCVISKNQKGVAYFRAIVSDSEGVLGLDLLTGKDVFSFSNLNTCSNMNTKENIYFMESYIKDDNKEIIVWGGNMTIMFLDPSKTGNASIMKNLIPADFTGKLLIIENRYFISGDTGGEISVIDMGCKGFYNEQKERVQLEGLEICRFEAFDDTDVQNIVILSKTKQRVIFAARSDVQEVKTFKITGLEIKDGNTQQEAIDEVERITFLREYGELYSVDQVKRIEVAFGTSNFCVCKTMLAFS